MKTLLNTRTNKMHWNCLILYGTRIAKTLMHHLNGVFQICKAKLYSPDSRNCMLCLTEKCHILFWGLHHSNKRNKVLSKCRHENKYCLSNCKSVPTQQDQMISCSKYWIFLQHYWLLTLNKKLSNQLDSMYHRESGVSPQVMALFVNIMLCRKYSTALLNVYRVFIQNYLSSEDRTKCDTSSNGMNIFSKFIV